MTGRFVRISTRTVVRQERPYRPLVDVTRGEPVVEHIDVDGVVAGFRTPAYEGGIGVPGGHVHFIDAALSPRRPRPRLRGRPDHG